MIWRVTIIVAPLATYGQVVDRWQAFGHKNNALGGNFKNFLFNKNTVDIYINFLH